MLLDIPASRIIRQMHKVADYLHTLSGLIHYKVSFFLVVLIGGIQTYLTIHSGKLSIPNTTIKWRRQRIERVLYICGGLLISAIVGVGVLNDQNQLKADNRADASVKQGSELGLQFAQFKKNFLQEGPPAKTSATSSPTPKGPTLPGVGQRNYETDLQNISRLAQSIQALDPTSGLNSRIQELLGTTWGLDHGYAYGAGQAFNQYDRHGQGQPPDLWLKSAAERPKGRDEAYAKLQPEITSLRHDIQVALKWPHKKIEADDSYFETLNAKALKPTPLPKTLDDDNDESYKFLEVRQYFADLDKKLGYTLPDGVQWLEDRFHR